MSEQHSTPPAHNRKTLGFYVTGFVLSLLFTIIAFALVGRDSLPAAYLYVIITVLAIAQLFAQSICFLRLNRSKEGMQDLMPFIFALLVVLVIVAGSVWIMWNLNYNMMH